MGLVAAIFAYLCGVTVLAVTLLMWFGALLYPPDQTTVAQQAITQQTIATAAKPRAAQPTPAAANERSGSLGVAQAPGNDANGDEASRPPHVRRLVRQVRARDWLHQKEAKAWGYAEEPSASFLYDRFQ
jgi:hypothetical protein